MSLSRASSSTIAMLSTLKVPQNLRRPASTSQLLSEHFANAPHNSAEKDTFASPKTTMGAYLEKSWLEREAYLTEAHKNYPPILKLQH